MQKSIKLAFLGLILTFVAAPTVCKPQNKTAQVNKKQQSFFSKVASNAPSIKRVGKVAIGLSFAGIGSTASLAIPYKTESIPKILAGYFYTSSEEIAQGLANIGVSLLVTYFSVKSGYKIAIS